MGREICRLFKSMDDCKAAAWWPDRVGGCLTVEPLRRSRERVREDELRGGKLGLWSSGIISKKGRPLAVVPYSVFMVVFPTAFSDDLCLGAGWVETGRQGRAIEVPPTC